ncbi:hypothetical protein ACMZ6Z_05340 [Streptococcus pluranimalium]|uniref:hypothetical protein n=1 Tax=Streptococcus pluranimalium TaxID=82348 RepID=UPI0039FD1AA9
MKLFSKVKAFRLRKEFVLFIAITGITIAVWNFQLLAATPLTEELTLFSKLLLLVPFSIIFLALSF